MRKEQWIGVLCVVLGVVFLAINISAQESNLVDAPIISDKVVTGENIRVVDKDEQQRVSDKTTERIQRLENRVADLENLVAQLQSVE